MRRGRNSQAGKLVKVYVKAECKYLYGYAELRM